MFICCFKQKTAYEMRISDWSSDVCSSDLLAIPRLERARHVRLRTVAQDQGEAGDRVERPQDERQADDLPQFLCRAFLRRLRGRVEIGRASCRERVCQYVSITVVAVSLKNKICTPKHKKKLPNPLTN